MLNAVLEWLDEVAQRCGGDEPALLAALDVARDSVLDELRALVSPPTVH